MNMRVAVSFSFLLLFVVIVFVVALNLLRGREGVTSTSAPGATITNHINDRSEAVYYRRGRLVAQEEHFGYRVTISQSARTMEILDGYSQVVSQRHTFPNNQAAYREFMYAISRQGLEGVADIEADSMTGVCPESKLSEFIVQEGSEKLAWHWRSDCGTGTIKQQTFEQTFKNQIPDFNQKLSRVAL